MRLISSKNKRGLYDLLEISPDASQAEVRGVSFSYLLNSDNSNEKINMIFLLCSFLRAILHFSALHAVQNRPLRIASLRQKETTYSSISTFYER